MASRYPYHHQNFQTRANNMGMPPVTMGLTTQQPHADIGNMARFPGLVPGMWNQQGPVQNWIPAQQQRGNWNGQGQKEREYLKQQQKLRAMSYSNKKSPVTADALIENLLGQKDTFVLKKNDESLVEKKIIPDGTIANGSSEIKMPVRKTQAPNQTTAPHHRVSQPKDSSAVSSNADDKEQGVHPIVGSILPNHGFPTWASGITGMALPVMYDRIWEAVGCPMGTGLADTGLLFPLLLTSGLQREVLGHIWALCNRTVPGQLTRPELNICLALIALAQNGHPFCNLSVLESVTQPPVPNLDLSTLPVPKRAAAPEVTAAVMTPSIPVFPATTRADLNAPILPSVSFAPSSHVPQSSSKVTQEDDWDDFTEFQSASNTVLDTPVEPLRTQHPESNANQSSSSAITTACTFNKSEKPSSVNSNQQNLVISPPIPLTLPTQGNRLLSAESSPVLSSRSSSERRGIGSRLANHTLGAPKTLKQSISSKTPDPSEEDDYDDFCEFRSGPPPSDGSQGSSVRKFTEQENDMLDDLFPRCTVRPPFKTEVLRESAIRSEAPAGDIFSIPKDSKGSGSKEAPSSGVDGWANSLQFPNVPSTVPKKGSDAKTPSPKTVSEAKVASPNAPVEEDRYSALRELAAEINPPQNASAKEEDDEDDDDDDFGDFLSARGTPAAPVSEDSFGEIARESALNKEDELTDDPFKILTPAATDPQPVNSTDWSADFSAFEVEQVPNREINNNETIPGNDDDFGDFVGGDRDEAIDSLRIEGGWLGSDRRGEGSIGTGEASPDSRSINAVAMEGEGNLGGRGRTGSLPSLDLKGFSMLGVGEGEGSSGEEGDGIASGEGRRNYCSSVGGEKCGLEQWESSKSAGQHAYEWRRCLASCLSLLQSALLIFSSISSGEVIEEVVSTEEGEDYLSNLLEVYWVSRRIAASYQQLDRRDSQLDNLLDDIGAVWEGLMPFYEKSGIMEVEYNLDLRSPEGVRKAVDGGVHCGVCLAVVSQDGDGEPLSQGLVYGGHHYHTTCANLWINCVDRLLPSLQRNPNAA